MGCFVAMLEVCICYKVYYEARFMLGEVLHLIQQQQRFNTLIYAYSVS